MTRALRVHKAGPGMTVQDMGRPGYLAVGLSRGGAMDRRALAEGAALLGQGAECAALEMAGMGGEFEATEDVRVALVGAPMRASVDGARVTWNASHLLAKGARLSIGPATEGVYGYLHIGGGFETEVILGSRSAHLAAGIGRLIKEGDQLPVGSDKANTFSQTLDPDPRFSGGTVRLVPSQQTDFFAKDERDRFETTTFQRDTRGNRMGVRLTSDGEGFRSEAGLSVLSEVIVPGDIQITGDGTPFVLMSEAQTTGGYPRIGAVLPADMPIVAQARPGTSLTFQFLTLAEAIEVEKRDSERRKTLRGATRPLIRRPEDIPDLLSYQLISGVVAAELDAFPDA